MLAHAKTILSPKEKDKTLISNQNSNVSMHAPRSKTQLASTPSENQNHNIHTKGVTFPVTDLPTFTGQMEKLLKFRDTFESLIHMNHEISDIQKYDCLRASLQGELSQVIKSIELSSQNYATACQTLCDRYNNTRLSIHIHTGALFSLQHIQKESATKICQTIDDVSKHLRPLQQLNEPIQHWDTLVIFLIISK